LNTIIKLIENIFQINPRSDNLINNTEIRNNLLVRHITNKRNYVIERKDLPKFISAEDDELFICKPILPSGELDNIKSFFFPKAELNLIRLPLNNT
jgi:hypothetical protein